MNMRYLGLMAVSVALAGCAVPVKQEENQPSPVPPEVLALAAPNQNVMSARLSPADNCYWYEYAGPVETTWIPLRSGRGWQICNQQA